MATYTFENIVINGVDTSKTYNDSTLPLRGVKRIICNGEDKLHKNVNTTLSSNNIYGWGYSWLSQYKKNVLDKVTLGDGVKSIEYIDDGTNINGFIIEFDIPATFSYNIEEDDTVAGGLVSYASDTVNNAIKVKLEFSVSALQITATNNEAVVYYDKTIKPDFYGLSISETKFIIKGRVY